LPKQSPDKRGNRTSAVPRTEQSVLKSEHVRLRDKSGVTSEQRYDDGRMFCEIVLLLDARQGWMFLLSRFYSPALVQYKTLQDRSLWVKLDEFRRNVPFPTFFDLSAGEVAEKLVFMLGIERFKCEWRDARPKDAQIRRCRSILCSDRPWQSRVIGGAKASYLPRFRNLNHVLREYLPPSRDLDAVFTAN
jgi:hypothetical protein